MDLSDTELILKAQKGDSRAFEGLVCRYDRRVLGLAMQYTNNLEDSRDIYQEVFLRVHRSLDKFRFKSKFSTWLFRITTNVCLTFRDREARLRHVSLDEEMDGRDGEGSKPMSLALVSAGRAEAETWSSEIGCRVREAVRRLSRQQRIVFALRYYEGYKLKEIARVLGCTQGTVKKHLFVATERMRQQLRHWVP